MPNTQPTLPVVIGYVTPLSAKPSELLQFKISSAGNRDIAASVFRLDCCDPNPDGPGPKSERVEFGLEERYKATEQACRLGSCAIGSIPRRAGLRGLTVRLVVQPKVLASVSQTIFSLQNFEKSTGIALILIDGALFLKSLRQPQTVIDLGLDLRLNEWTKLEVAFGEEAISVRSSAIHGFGTSDVTVDSNAASDVPLEADQICFAATWVGYPEDCFNGSIEAPLVSDGGGDVLASWNFADNIGREWVEDTVDRSRRLALINMPMRAVRSSSWIGRNMDWKIAPQDYAAITFHSDDLSDCKWETTIAVKVPAAMPSGVYGLSVSNGIGTDIIPFYVLRSPELPRQRLLYLAPTFTYMAYANHARGNFIGSLEARVKEWNAYPHNPDVIGAYGHSTYNRHPDGSGITLSSRLRPMMTMRPQYLTFFDANGSGLRHFSADSHLTDWLRVKGLSFDVLTDEDLDRDGASALSGYDVVLTGTHPEYHTRQTLDALISYREGGGRLMYLGGNGFYWKIGRNPNEPHMIEIRRAESGMRVWASRAGEYYNQLDGEYGGLWRRNGIAPQMVAGVGFTAEGAFEGTYYVRTKESFETDLAFLFDGIPDGQRIGDFGLSGGGAAGFEIDQAAADLGTPDFVSVVAVSEGHGPTFETTFEELLLPGVLDGTRRPHGGIRSNIVYGMAANGGGLFSAGSITFCGSLSHNGYENDVSRLLENCLRKFLEVPR